MACRYFYDLPVYRLPSAEYYSARSAHIEAIVFQVGTAYEPALRLREKTVPRANDAFRAHLEHTYGGCWEFNEIIGYIRLHFLGSQVRGEYFAAGKRRIVRARTKTFVYKTHKLAPEIDIEAPFGSKEVLAAVQQYIAACKRQLARRYIDTSRFDAVARYIKWSALFRGDA